MHIELDLSNLLELIAVAVSGLCGKVDLTPKKVCSNISNVLSVFSIAYLVLGVFNLADYFVMMVLRFLQRNWVGICLYIMLFAMIPPAVALWEQKKKNARIEQSYVKGNLIYNILGAFSACIMFWLAHDIVGDFFDLKNFHVEGIISVLIPSCAGFVLSYQSIEQHKELPDHEADTKWLNQKLNMLHLFHAFFFSAVSVVLIVCYSIYCHIHNMHLTIRPNYFLFITFALIFFYALSQHFHRHVYMVFVVMVPVILVSSVYWMSWFSMSKAMRCMQWIFVVVHSLLYAGLIFYRNKMIFIGKQEEMDANRYGKTHKIQGNCVWAIEHGGFQVILLLIIIICYSISWVVPMLTQRVDGRTAEKFIVKICEDTDTEADEIIASAREQSAYDPENHDYDREKYLKFVYDELYELMLDKGIIDESSEFLTYDVLQHWYLTIP